MQNTQPKPQTRTRHSSRPASRDGPLGSDTVKSQIERITRDTREIHCMQRMTRTWSLLSA